MRRGAHPKDAGMTALKRVQKNTIEKRLPNDRGQPNFSLNFYILNAKGEFAGVSMFPSNSRCAPRRSPQTLDTEALFQGKPS